MVRICTLDEIKRFGKEILIFRKLPFAPPNRFTSLDFCRFPCDLVNVFCESKNGLFHICWVLSVQVPEPEHPTMSKVENVVGVCRFFQQESKMDHLNALTEVKECINFWYFPIRVTGKVSSEEILPPREVYVLPISYIHAESVSNKPLKT